MGPADAPALVDHDAADGDLVGLQGGVGLAEGLAHPARVVGLLGRLLERRHHGVALLVSHGAAPFDPRP